MSDHDSPGSAVGAELEELLTRLSLRSEARAGASGGVSRAAFQLACRHGLAPMLFHNAVKERREAGADPQVTREWTRHVLMAEVMGKKLITDARAAVTQLSAAGIDVIVLKGLHLAAAVYASPGLRPMGDIDLLVRWEQANAARDALLRIGYAPIAADALASHHHLPRLVSPTAFPIEVHWALTTQRGHIHVDIDGLWNRAERIQVGGVAVGALCPEDLLVHLSLHAANHHGFFVPLRAVLDIALVIERLHPRIDWRRLHATAAESGTRRAVFCGLLLASELLGAPVAPEHVDAFDPGSDRKALVRAALSNMLSFDRPCPAWVSRLHADVPLRSKVRQVLGHVFLHPQSPVHQELPLGRRVGLQLSRIVKLFQRNRARLRDLILHRPVGRTVLLQAQQGRFLETWLRHE